ncbi:hypothetical protein [Roseateles sp.]|uniref:hypothetical protein n=1 Tax=Roseateles sp. TaxID=1971397 RepID=UPI003BA78863
MESMRHCETAAQEYLRSRSGRLNAIMAIPASFVALAWEVAGGMVLFGSPQPDSELRADFT